jgi:hypothetical protein
MPSMCNFGYFSLIVFLYWQYMFRPNRPSSGVQVVMNKESAAHCKAALFLLCGCLGLHLVTWVSYLWWPWAARAWLICNVMCYVRAQDEANMSHITDKTSTCSSGTQKFKQILNPHNQTYHNNLYTWWCPVRPKHVVSTKRNDEWTVTKVPHRRHKSKTLWRATGCCNITLWRFKT